MTKYANPCRHLLSNKTNGKVSPSHMRFGWNKREEIVAASINELRLMVGAAMPRLDPTEHVECDLVMQRLSLNIMVSRA